MPDFIAQIQIFIEQKPQRGEDCEPVLQFYPDGSALLAVFDGAGGAGGTAYQNADGGSFTGAFLASRLGRQTLVDFFDELKRQASSFAADTALDQLEERFKIAFKTELARIEPPSGARIKSSLIRHLPTTLAAIYYENAPRAETENGFASWQNNIAGFFGAEKTPPPSKHRGNVFWAGDSRCYLLTAAAGLQQLTEDDLKSKGDALANLVEDSPMSNFINADVDFVLNFRRLELDLPAVLLAATDGCFNFVASPAHFEFLLLKTLHFAENADDWQTNLSEEIGKITGDDATMSLVALGWRGFDEIKHAFRSRLYEIQQTYVAPLNRLKDEIGVLEERLQSQKEEKQELREKLWREYKPNYERFLTDERTAK